MGPPPPPPSPSATCAATDASGPAAFAAESGAPLDAGPPPSGQATDEPAASHVLMLGETVGRYHVRRLLGEGGMGRVYLARDMTLGRSAALKVVRRELSGAGATARFIEEARTIALLNHPHIVQLYDVGNHRGALYLALEYVSGETLQQRGAREALSVDEVMRVGRAIAGALAHAHGLGVYHCDLKPSNIILGQDGRLRVVDFGLARTASTAVGGRLEGTPEWMAPEQWARLPPSDRVDVWALGAMMTRLLTGRRPFDDADPRRAALDLQVAPRRVEREDVAPPLRHLIARSLEREPSARPSAREWHEVLEQLLGGRAGSLLEEAPFRGLAAFDERHASFFFGREREVDAFLEQLRAQPLVPIVGPSGAGKSSFLHAGVIPRLRAREPTVVLSFRPGHDPVGALARHVLVAGLTSADAGRAAPGQNDVTALADSLRETPTLIAARLATVSSARRASVLVAVDQLEEVFTQGASSADAQCFLELLRACADDPRDPVRVAFTLRDDFLGRVSGLRSLFVVRGLQGDDLRRAITGPLRQCGYAFDDDALVDDMLAEIGTGQAADLPLLQFACRALWDGRDVERRRLLRATYERVGGVAGALARHADGVLSASPPAERRLLQRLLLRLIAGSTRRAVDRATLLDGLQASAEPALDRLLSARLIVQRVSQDGEGAMFEIAHESLLRSWGQLARWIDESREERRLLAELEDAALHWERRSRRPEETWPAADLLAMRRQIAKLGLELPPRLEAFLAAGERRQRALRRRAGRRLAMVAALGGGAVVAALAFAAKFRLAGGNMGQVDLVLVPFDWVDGEPRPVEAAELPALSWRLYGPLSGDEHRPGPPLPPELVRVTQGSNSALRVDRVEAPGGAAFLRVEGRGRAGESCPPSWVRLQNLPGYLSRRAPPPVWRIEIPTCRASASGTIVIDAGPFVYGGPGEPPTQFQEYVEPEREVALGAYAIDRTEVSNAQARPFFRLAAVTGYAPPRRLAEGRYAHDGAPEMPLTAVDAFQAEAFCRYMGKRLPGDLEWVKAARGGKTVGGAQNPAPRRLYPWGASLDVSCANAGGDADDAQWLAPVGAFPCGASPYGVLNLAGNVSEWVAREGQADADVNPLRVLRGGDVDSPWKLEQTTTVFRNAREARHFHFAVGFRCVLGDEAHSD